MALVSTNRFSRSIPLFVITWLYFLLCSIYPSSINMTVSRFDGILYCIKFTVDRRAPPWSAYAITQLWVIGRFRQSL
ncbi:hypothetical protein BDV36DRAFT_258882, partial [Aspergillus pseudocaelatus]